MMSQQKVTISTCHAAKGLEWPVVMVPSGQCITLTGAYSTDISDLQLSKEFSLSTGLKTMRRKGEAQLFVLVCHAQVL